MNMNYECECEYEYPVRQPPLINTSLSLQQTMDCHLTYFLKVALNYMLDMTDASEVPFQQCIPGFAYDSALSAYSAKFCWRDACLPDRFSNAAFAVFTQVTDLISQITCISKPT